MTEFLAYEVQLTDAFNRHQTTDEHIGEKRSNNGFSLSTLTSKTSVHLTHQAPKHG